MLDRSISSPVYRSLIYFFFQAEDGIRDGTVTGVQTCALPIWMATLYLQSAAGGLYRGDDLAVAIEVGPVAAAEITTQAATVVHNAHGDPARLRQRSEERRVGKGCGCLRVGDEGRRSREEEAVG